jgi:hypothetical protein
MMSESEGVEIDPKREAHMSIELGMILQVKFFDSGESFRGILVGMERGFYLILRTPAIDSMQERVGGEGGIIVRYTLRGVPYGFVCSVLAYIDHPIHLAVFSYPDVIQNINYRSEGRVSCFVPSSFMMGGKSYRGYISNISLSGCQLILDLPSDESFPDSGPGQEVRVAAQLTGTAEIQILNVSIQSVRREEREMIIGMQFVNLDKDVLNDVRGFIKNITEFENIRKPS